MISVRKIIPIFFALTLINSCKIMTNDKNLREESQEDIKADLKLKENQLEISFSCGEDEIKKYVADGWIIVEEFSKEKICTWKSFPATKGCDMERDKGCKITMPDKIGQEKIYLLRR